MVQQFRDSDILWGIDVEHARDFCRQHRLAPLSNEELDHLITILCEQVIADEILHDAIEQIEAERLTKNGRT